MALSLLLALVAGAVSGFAPALAALRVNLVDQLKAGSRSVVGAGRGQKLRNLLAVSQIALAVALVIGAALMCKGMYGMLHLVDRYNPDQKLIFDVHLPAARYDTPQKMAAWYNQSVEKLRALPGVQHAEAASALPYSDRNWMDDFLIENRPLAPGKSQPAMRLTVTDGYFSQFHIGVVSGRMFTASDDLRSQPVAVVSKSLADRYFPGENVIGKRIRMKTGTAEQTPWLTIVGVAEETNYTLWDRSKPVAVYANAAQLPPSGLTYAITTSGDPQAIAPEVHKALATIDPTLPLDQVESYSKFMHEDLTGIFYVAGMLGFDALVALVLAAIGIFGVMANLVGERTREIGVRLAMGAQREDVLRMILRRAGTLTAIGVSVGLVLAFAVAHGVANLLYQVSPNDPLIFSTITATIIVIALLASWLPAWRAARIDPIVALRDE
jgi:putative ABC transport system permease protein